MGSNAVIRAIDLGTEVLSPAFAGYVMAVLSVSVGAAIIAAWNLMSLCVEAALYYRVWRLCPSIQAKKEDKEATSSQSDQFCPRLLTRLKELATAWTAFMRHEVRSAGLALAFLYMTVLSLDNYSRAYLFESGVNEAWLGVFVSLSSVPGLLGSLLFPRLRKKFGVERVGLIGFAWLSASLSLCVVSVFVPGSLFYLVSDNSNNAGHLQPSLDATSTFAGNVTEYDALHNNTIQSFSLSPAVEEGKNASALDGAVFLNTSSEGIASSSNEGSFTENPLSVLLLLIGMIVSRFGLWTADLSVVQSFQELVAPEMRGALSGVQEALNMLFSLLRSVLLIAFPRMDTFGYLIMLSFAFVFMGFLSYCHFYQQRRTSARVANRRNIIINEARTSPEEAAAPLKDGEQPTPEEAAVPLEDGEQLTPEEVDTLLRDGEQPTPDEAATPLRAVQASSL